MDNNQNIDADNVKIPASSQQKTHKLQTFAILQGFFLFILTIVIAILGFTPDAGIGLFSALFPYVLVIAGCCFLYYISESISQKTIFPLASYLLGIF